MRGWATKRGEDEEDEDNEEEEGARKRVLEI